MKIFFCNRAHPGVPKGEACSEVLLKYALAHDLVETFSGDVDSIKVSPQAQTTKTQ
ncbi:MAG: hypothetical protein ACOCXT_02875 [Candidatus Dojkabacteria bacterium]